jgi:hypothetical protein
MIITRPRGNYINSLVQVSTLRRITRINFTAFSHRKIIHISPNTVPFHSDLLRYITWSSVEAPLNAWNHYGLRIETPLTRINCHSPPVYWPDAIIQIINKESLSIYPSRHDLSTLPPYFFAGTGSRL